MKNSRRNFIKKSSLGLIGFTLITSNSFVFSNTNIGGQSIEEILKEASNLKNAKEFLKSESLYLSAIDQYPKDIRAYFGLRKVYLAQNKFLENVRLFESAIKNHPNESIFFNQLAKEYTTISLGNLKLVKQLNYEFSLIDRAKELYLQAKKINNSTPKQINSFSKNNSNILNNPNLGLMKIDIIKSNSLDSIDARDNPNAKKILFKNRLISSKLEKNLSINLLENRILELKNKSKNYQRNKHIKKSYRELIYKLFKEKEYDLSYKYAKELYFDDEKDLFSFNLLKKACYKAKKFDNLEVILKNNDDIQKTNWSRISYIKGLVTKYEYNDRIDSTQIKELLNSFENKYKLTPSTSLEINFLKAKYYILKKEYNSLELVLNILNENLIGTENVHNIVRYMNTFSNYYINKNKKAEAITLINSFLFESNDYKTTENLSEKILELSKIKSFTISKTSHLRYINNLKRRIQAT